MAKDNSHIVMVPWSAFGHILPFFHLSVALAKSGVKISFISTPTIIQRLPPIPHDLVQLVKLVKFPLPELDGDRLPEGAEATVDLPPEKIGRLKTAYDLLQHPLKKFVADEKPDWIVIDLIPHWIVEIAGEYGVALMHFYVGSAASLLFFNGGLFFEKDMEKKAFPNWESLTVKPNWVDFPSSVAYTKHEAIQVHDWLYRPNESGISDAERFTKIAGICQALAVRSCPEIEGEYLNSLQKVLGKPVIPAGLLPPEKPKPAGEFTGDSWSQVFEWLDQQSPKSVVFVGFGSEFKLSKDQIFEIAYGLEQSGLPFLWVLRKPSWANSDLDAFPAGFTDRICRKGIVKMGWAPQMEILGHPSIGGSLFHSGWGSIIEMLEFGHKLVLLPFIIDQSLNARLMVEKSLGVEVERNEEDGSFSRDGICKALKLAMESDEGKILGENASEAAKVFGDQKLHQDCYIHDLAEFLRNKENSGKKRISVFDHLP